METRSEGCRRTAVAWRVGAMLLAGWLLAGQANAERGLLWRPRNDAPPPIADGVAAVFHDRLWTFSTTMDHARYSSDGSRWIDVGSAPSPPRSEAGVAEFKGSLWIVGGIRNGVRLGDIWRSSDGATWERVTTTAPFGARSEQCLVSFAGSLWLLGGSVTGGWYTDVWRSEDGVQWTRVIDAAPYLPRGEGAAFVFDGKMWSVGNSSNGGDIWCTSDGTSWTLAAGDGVFPFLMSPAVFQIDGTLWLIAGTGSSTRTWSSQDGFTWTLRNGTLQRPRTSHSILGFRNKAWIIDASGVRSTSDGLEWPRVAPPHLPALPGLAYNFSTCVFREKLWALEGSRNGSYGRVWSTANGSDWVIELDQGQYLPRYDEEPFATAEFQDRMWLIGGQIRGGLSLCEVSSTADGKNWSRATLQAPFGPRWRHLSVDFRDRLWVVGGNVDDTWSSADGVAWQQEAIGPDSVAAEDLCVYEDKMWAIAGTQVSSSADGKSWQSEATIVRDSTTFDYDLDFFLVTDGQDLWAYESYFYFVSNSGGGVSSVQVANLRRLDDDHAGWSRVAVLPEFPRYAVRSAFFKDRLCLITESGDITSSGSGPALAIDPPSLRFDTDDGAPPQTLAVTVSNTWPDGWDPLLITDVAIENDATGAFSLVGDPDLRALLVDESREYTVAFDRTQPGLATAELVIRASNPETPETRISLSGVGISDNVPSLITLGDNGDLWAVKRTAGDDTTPAPQRLAWLGYRHEAATGDATLAGDWSGDGAVDLLTVTAGGELWVARNDGTGTFSNTFLRPEPALFSEGKTPFLADVDADGDADLVALAEDGSVRVAASDGATFAPFAPADGGGILWHPSLELWAGMADVDADGRADIVGVDGLHGTASASLRGDTSFAAAAPWGTPNFHFDRDGGWGLHLADVDGDRRADLVQIGPEGRIDVSLSTGASFAEPTTWGSFGFHDEPLRGRGWNVFPADMDRDGRDDLVQLTEHGDWWWSLSTGTSFAQPQHLGWTGFAHQPDGPWQAWIGAVQP